MAAHARRISEKWPYSWFSLLLLEMLIVCVNHFFQNVSFLTTVFNLVIVDFDLSLPVGDMFFWSNDSGTINSLLGLDRIFNTSFYHFTFEMLEFGRSWVVGVSVVDSFEFCSIYFDILSALMFVERCHYNILGLFYNSISRSTFTLHIHQSSLSHKLVYNGGFSNFSLPSLVRNSTYVA